MKFLGKLIGVLYIIWVVWTTATPTATLHFPETAIGEIRYQWNARHRIFRGELYPGERVTDWGDIFPKEDFFMVVDWWADGGRRQCVKVIPKWYGTDIYLDANGQLDQSPEGGTDLDRVMHCTNRPEENITCRPC
ncbi:hypothetical protein [Pseudomonas syringae]|jgi:hypothetical protein|uniref:hypothetical protein n=1 Tax=Pseudomonas syringae TaxID=317 RepID=UPI00067AC6B1|nr:hypothetical protein [Pseudomonas syringae]